MNKRIFYLIIALLIIISLFSAKIYFNTKNTVLEQSSYLISLESKIKKVYALKNKYKFNQNLFNRLKRFCKISNSDDKYIIVCNNLNAKNFSNIQNIIFKNNFKIQDFKINKDKLANLKAEINK